MSFTSPDGFRDRQDDWLAYYDSTRRPEVLELITPELISEHERNPVGYRGFHSPDLQRVLNYLRTEPVPGKYFVYTEETWEVYRVASIGARGEGLQVLEGRRYSTEEEAMHAVFLLRVEGLERKVGVS